MASASAFTTASAAPGLRICGFGAAFGAECAV